MLEQARARDAAAAEAKERAAGLKDAESSIRFRHHRIAAAKAARARAKRISAESGYENPAMLASFPPLVTRGATRGMVRAISDNGDGV